LFDRLGGTIDLHDVNAFDALSPSTATIAAHFAYLNTISQWLVSRNIPEQLVTDFSPADRYPYPFGIRIDC
jgi:pyrroline-5-carboxylate reductase